MNHAITMKKHFSVFFLSILNTTFLDTSKVIVPNRHGGLD